MGRTRTGGGSKEEVLRRAKVPHLEAVVGSDTRLGRIAGRARFLSNFMLDAQRWVKAASGVQFREVGVDAETGETRVSRWVGVFDIGRVINAKTSASQMRGGIVMGLGLGLGPGLGLAMAGETLVDPRNGRIMNPAWPSTTSRCTSTFRRSTCPSWTTRIRRCRSAFSATARCP
ncbi:molybdopterin cofactor-binding domain-containing protein [Streptomyces sp. DSM 3412]|uniref:Molybdopterin cofactor-binding domain-containing protein n=1 Tax=Streptomyces gottesmaniae TaxID=3075518 RepID=A0ABU2Z155_9ACTN|nr:molybdopterin cofactor-binding domain-containing protein [Streptomyces sp. DSM 3412]MDT0570313.1 molybdopterin cofactor-binding domain-containing protein [Streptomyces sp. DSM 3412]